MTCKDCFHYEVCCDEYELEHAEYCNNFKDKSKVIELPCRVGDTVYIKGIPLIISSIYIENEIGFVFQFDCEDCYKCPFYEDEVSFEGEHDCRTQGYLEFTVNDIGKTVFLTKEEAEARLKELQNNK